MNCPLVWSRAESVTSARNGGVYAVLADVARPIIRQHFSADSCIASTRIVCAALAQLDIKAEPRVVDVLVFNNSYGHMIDSGENPADSETFARWQAEHGAWAVGVGAERWSESDGTDWPGHLVVVTRDRVMIDAALDQCDRPARNIEAPPVMAVKATRGFLAGSTALYVELPKGHAVYHWTRGVPFPVHAPDWVEPTRIVEPTRQLVAAIRAAGVA